MDKTSVGEIEEIVRQLCERSVKVNRAHELMGDAVLDAVTIAHSLPKKVTARWRAAAQSHRRLGREIRELLRETTELKLRLDAKSEERK